MSKIAIITLNYNGKKDTLELLESLKRLKLGEFETLTIVVDNASGDGSVKAIKEEYPKVNVIQTGANLGFAGGFNKGIEYAKVWGADYFLLLNNDCLVRDENLLLQLIKTTEFDKEIGLVSPKIYFARGFEFHKDKYRENELGKVIWFGGGKFDWNNIGNIHKGLDEVDNGQLDQIEESEIFSGACVLVKKEVFEKIGVFDKKYFLYFEDSDLAFRVKSAGFKIYYNGKVSIYHKVSQSTGIGSEITDYFHSRNRLIFGLKYARLKTKLALLREASKLLIVGRSVQRKGVLDYFLGIRGSQTSSGKADLAEYPLKLSIGIVNYNTADLTKKLLESIFKPNSGFDPKSMEVIVLDNGNVDPCKEQIKEFLPKIKYLKNEENEGFSKGYNKTIKYSLGKYYLMLNSDIEVLKGSLEELIKYADQYQGEAILGGKLIFPDKTKQDSAFHLPTIIGAYEEYFRNKKGAYFMYQPQGDKPTKVEGLVMACLLIPQKVILKIGLLDEGSFIFFEDIEYAARALKFKVPMYFIPPAKFIHHHGASTKKIGKDKAYSLLQKSAKRYHGNFYYFLLSLVLRIGQKLGRVKTPVSRWSKD